MVTVEKHKYELPEIITKNKGHLYPSYMIDNRQWLSLNSPPPPSLSAYNDMYINYCFVLHFLLFFPPLTTLSALLFSRMCQTLYVNCYYYEGITSCNAQLTLMYYLLVALFMGVDNKHYKEQLVHNNSLICMIIKGTMHFEMQASLIFYYFRILLVL